MNAGRDKDEKLFWIIALTIVAISIGIALIVSAVRDTPSQSDEAGAEGIRYAIVCKTEDGCSKTG
ncbi:hypothetical protein [Cohnella panacarvi]|uniref:hypothetical protein n=1 Tax=Cohnella panacarvi TaxID=400776 RepID=UPI00047EF34E|nr:hypothetical protein [Cohnella panacarvi]